MKNYTYQEFINQVVENIKDHLPEDYRDANIKIKQINRQGDNLLDGLIVERPNEKVVPIIYLNDFYDLEYKAGKDIDEVIKRIASLRTESNVPTTTIKGASLRDFNEIKDTIVPRLVNIKNNKGYLKDKPHKKFNDLAVIFAAKIKQFPNESNPDAHGSMPITNDLLEMYGVSLDELEKIAMANLKKQGPVIMPFKEFDPSISSEDFNMIIITNTDTMHGAAVMLDEDAMKKVSEILGDNAIIIPSSVHELIAVPATGFRENAINEMIESVNASIVNPFERLSNHIYVYDKEAGRVVMPEVFFDRKEFNPENVTEQSWEEFKSHARSSVLHPVFDKTYNFRGSAKVFEMHGFEVLESHGEPVAYIKDGQAKLIENKDFSDKTSTQILEFFNQAAGEKTYESLEDVGSQKKERDSNQHEGEKKVSPAAKIRILELGNDRSR